MRTSYRIPSLRIGKRTALIIEASNHNEEMRNVPLAARPCGLVNDPQDDSAKAITADWISKASE